MSCPNEISGRVTMRMRRTFTTLRVVASLVAAGCLIGAPAPAGPAAVEAPQGAAAPAVTLPNESGSLKFAVLGDFGTAERPEYELAAQMAKFYTGFKLELVVLVGDNLYGAERPQDFKAKFEDPYKPLLDAGVKFYASLGNHDARAQRYYKPFNMEGKLYYSFKAPKEKVRFFMLDSTYPVPEQIDWLEKELKGSSDEWKIAVFHHPPYSSGGRHGSDLKLRETLEPLFIKYGVSVVLNGHDHFYERIKPQHGIVYFVVGSGGQLAAGDIDKRSDLTAKGFDTDRAFMAVEISGDKMYFNAISREGQVVDSGILSRRNPQ
jgi:predicted MPP superfamily phosphohydrolase